MFISKVKIENPLLLAPMAGVTDQPFRQICKELGAGMVYTEFVSANGIIRENMKTLNMIKFKDIERPIGVQIFGDDPENLGNSASFIEQNFSPDVIDINFGCPVPKITKKGAGSAALKDLCLMDESVSAVIGSVKNTPITVKMRAGWDKNSIVSTEAGISLENLGVKAITLHPRTTSQMFSEKADWSLIKDLKKAVSIPVIGNGDIKNFNDYRQMLEYTKCDAVMIGRAALGNPWIFSHINNKEISENPIVTRQDKFNMCVKHFEMICDYYKNEIQCINLTKKHFSWYLKGFHDAKQIRVNFLKINSLDEMKKKINELFIN